MTCLVTTIDPDRLRERPEVQTSGLFWLPESVPKRLALRLWEATDAAPQLRQQLSHWGRATQRALPFFYFKKSFRF